MNPTEPNVEPLDDDIAALLQRGAPRPSLAPDVKDRLVRRAAASAVAGGFLASFAAKAGLASVAVGLVAVGAVVGVGVARAPSTPAVAPEVAPAAVVPAALDIAAPDIAAHDVPAPDVAAPVALAAPVAPAPSPRSSPVKSTATLPKPEAAARDEVALLEQARVAIGDNRAAAALAVLAQHRRQFSRGSLAEEREALVVVATARSGDLAGARAAAETFRRRFPRSAFRGLVDAAVE